ncbi:hypothetical protein TNCV_794681 [Trichonephila clavipes]|nr:hypothetical protein TNCV_794681 [Trichonephila clavipes]
MLGIKIAEKKGFVAMVENCVEFRRGPATNRVSTPQERDLSANGVLFTRTIKVKIFQLREPPKPFLCNHASLPHPLNQSGDSHSSRPIHIRPHLTFSIWDGGTLHVPFPSDDQRPVLPLTLHTN